MDYEQTKQDYYPNGLLRTREIFHNDRHLACENYYYHSNGNIEKITKTNKYNLGHGEWKFFNEDGVQEYSEIYKNGLLHYHNFADGTKELVINADRDFIEFLENKIKNLFLCGFPIHDAATIYDSWSMFLEPKPEVPNTTLHEILKINQKDIYDTFGKEYCYFKIKCEACGRKYQYVDLDSLKTCKNTKCLKDVNILQSIEVDAQDYIEDNYFENSYRNYIYDNAEIIFNLVQENKTKSNGCKESDVNIFKSICYDLFFNHKFGFYTASFSASGNTSWCNTDLLYPFYEGLLKKLGKKDQSLMVEELYWIHINTDTILNGSSTEMTVNKKFTNLLMDKFNERFNIKIDSEALKEVEEDILLLEIDWTTNDSYDYEKQYTSDI